MKKFITILLLLIGITVLLNINVTTRQGINYELHTIRMPLYLKILDFFDRHYNYKQLVKLIVGDIKTDQERVMKIFEWTYNNLKKAPEGFPVVDDHVWNIVVRGYGTDDQFSDVFTTLCNYARIPAFYSWIYTADKKNRIPLSFTKVKEKWLIFDPYRSIYFKDKNGNLADIELIKSTNRWSIEYLSDKTEVDYTPYFKNLILIQEARI